MLINRQNNLDALCEQLRFTVQDAVSQGGAAPIGIDTEFISERRYYARLCLVQVFLQVFEPAHGDSIEALIDPFAVDMTPLLELMADASILKIVHAGGQDLQIFSRDLKRPARNVFDTQIAAAFLGYGHQIGYVDLVRRLVGGPHLSKTQQFTDWAARPLSFEQMEYALDDVRYLPPMYDALRHDLSRRGRLAWAEAEFLRAEERAMQVPADDEIYRKLNVAGLNRRQLGTLRELAATREAMARRIDKPPTFIVPDLVLQQMAKQPPVSLNALRSMRGMPGLTNDNARELMSAVERAAALPNEELPERPMGEKPDPQTDAVAGLLGVVTQMRAQEQDISRTYLAPREQLFALAAWWLRRDGTTPPAIPLLSDWRRELLGNELLDLLAGKLALRLDATPNRSPLGVIEIK